MPNTTAPASVARCYARAYRTTAQSIPSGTWTPITLDAEQNDTPAGQHDTVSNTERLTCLVAGTYVISASVAFAPSSSGAQRNLGVLLNNTTWLAEDSRPPHGTNPNNISFALVRELAVGDFVHMQVYQDTGGALNINSPAQDATWERPALAWARIGTG